MVLFGLLGGWHVFTCPPSRTARLHDEKGNNYQRQKHTISNRKNSLIRVVKNQPLDPMLNKAPMITRVHTGLHSQLIFPGCQGANRAGETFSRDKSNQRHMSHAKPEIARKSPASKMSNPYCRQST